MRTLVAAKDSIDELVRVAADERRKIVAAVGVYADEIAIRAQQPERRPRAAQTVADAEDVEVVVVDRRVDVHGPGSDRREHVRKVEGHSRRVGAVLGSDLRHVAAMAPAGEIAAVVGGERVEAATGDDDLQAIVERGEKQGVVPAERVADHADATAVDLGKTLQEIDGAAMIDDPLHGRADVTMSVRIELVVAVIRIVGRQGDVAALGEFERIVKVFQSAYARRFALADLRRLMKTEHRWMLR